MNNKIVIITLSVVVILLALALVNVFIIKPAIEERRVDALNEGISYAVFTIMTEVSTCKVMPLTFQNQTIEIVAVECLQQQIDIEEGGNKTK